MTDITAEDRFQLEVAAAMRSMVVSAGWTHFERIMKAHAEQMQESCLRPFSVARKSDPTLSQDDYREVTSENKGALYGIRLALTTPKAIMDTAEDIMAKVPPEQRHVIEEGLS